MYFLISLFFIIALICSNDSTPKGGRPAPYTCAQITIKKKKVFPV